MTCTAERATATPVARRRGRVRVAVVGSVFGDVSRGRALTVASKAKVRRGPRPASRDGDGEREPLIPPGAAALLDARAVRRLLGVGQTMFAGMISDGSYPKADVKLGKLNRWTVEAHNAAVEGLRARGRTDHGGG